MKKALGIFGLLVFVCLFTTILNPDFIKPYNIQNTLRWTSLFGIISIGVSFVIITGGIDLSIGSMIGLIGCMLPLCLSAMSGEPSSSAIAWTLTTTGGAVGTLGLIWLAQLAFRRQLATCGRAGLLAAVGIACCAAGFVLPTFDLSPAVTIGIVLLWMIEVSVVVGVFHGLLITKGRLQPFVVTLCGLLYYRGLARWLADDQTQGFGTGYEGLKSLATGRPCTMALLMLLLGIAVSAWAVWRMVQRRKGEQPLIAPWCVLIAGAALAIVSGLQFTQDISGLAALERQGKPAETLTQQGMAWLGWIGAWAGVIALNIVAMRRGDFRVLIADLVTGIGLGLLSGVLHYDANDLWIAEYETIVGGETVVAEVDATALRVPLTVAGLVAAVGGAVWFLLTVWRGAGLALRSGVFLTAVAIVFSLAGATPIDRVEVPAPFLIMAGLAVLAGFFLNYTIYGRYLLALGRNEEAARLSGINTGAMIVLAYVICSVLAGVAGVLFALDVNSVQPSGHGNFYELYAIAAAVLGGCSLRGGEGSILGVVVGAAVMRVLYNAINILGIPTQLEFTIIGVVILIGVVVDEMFKRIAERRARKQAS